MKEIRYGESKNLLTIDWDIIISLTRYNVWTWFSRIFQHGWGTWINCYNAYSHISQGNKGRPYQLISKQTFSNILNDSDYKIHGMARAN